MVLIFTLLGVFIEQTLFMVIVFMLSVIGGIFHVSINLMLLRKKQEKMIPDISNVNDPKEYWNYKTPGYRKGEEKFKKLLGGKRDKK